MTKLAAYLAGLVALIPILPAHAMDWQFSGYAKSYLLAQDDIPIDQGEGLSSNQQSQSALRLMLNGFLTDQSNIEIHYELQPVYYSDAEYASNSGGISSTLAVGANSYRVKDLNAVLNDSQQHMVIWQNLDRLNYRYSDEHGDLTIGRQVIAFGSARFINPTDIFIPFNIQTLNQEYRVGIDAIRYQAELGSFAQLDTGMIIGEDAKQENLAAFIRGKNSWQGNDIELMAIGLDRAWLLGGGIERALGDFGFWFEAAYMAWQQTDADDYWRSSIGLDYAFNDQVIGMLEFHYNGAGSTANEDYLPLLNSQAYQRGGVYLLGQHYLIPALSWQLLPLTTLQGSAFFNLDDQSVFMQLALEQSWSDNLYSDIGLYLSDGDGLFMTGNPAELQAGSEFGSFPASIYASLRYYF